MSILFLQRPSITYQDIYAKCKVERCKTIDPYMQDIIDAARTYDSLALTHDLHTYKSITATNKYDTTIIDTLKKMYTHDLVTNKNGKPYYDKLRLSSRLCPYCGIGTASTIDHYLPQSVYSEFSILPLNLLPSCMDCNKTKNAQVCSNVKEQYIHPYYDKIDFDWLEASIIYNNSEIERPDFFINQHIHGVVADKIKFHFDNLKLKINYEIRAAQELESIKKDVKSLRHADIKEEMICRCNSYLNNSWQWALYKCLSNDMCFCQLHW